MKISTIGIIRKFDHNIFHRTNVILFYATENTRQIFLKSDIEKLSYSEYPFAFRTIFTIWSCSNRESLLNLPFLQNMFDATVLLCSFPMLLLFRISTLGIFVCRSGDVALGESPPLSELSEGSIVFSFRLRLCSNLLKNLKHQIELI